MEQIGKNIRTLRQQQGWCQAEVAKRLQISIPAFSKIETGITDINISRLEQIATLFDVMPIQIMATGIDPAQHYLQQIESLKQTIIEKDQEIIKMQTKLIGLYDELRTSHSRFVG